jgi:ribosomal protein S18 acetylase RimI-like enzyme
MSSKKNLINSKDFNVRYTLLEDEPFLRKWLKSSGMLHWFSMEEESEVDEMIKIWISFTRVKASLTATYQNKPCGMGTLFLMPYVKLIHATMGYLIVDPSFQKKGVGTTLVRNLDHLAKTYFRFERMHYEVYGDNPLIRLLLRQGYSEVFKQERYLKEDKGYLPRTVLEKVFKGG